MFTLRNQSTPWLPGVPGPLHKVQRCVERGSVLRACPWLHFGAWLRFGSSGVMDLTLQSGR